ncbi:LysR substrate binding domain-containing protein [Paraburkholderia caballeronis]|uniref:LysR substrate binding domain-containing protein n=2 Tax=Paraburkholderia caballeronis TaxID=416943 RepID=A0A1H7L4W9_9BURK|nr:LysR substrate binding domain-containing protein [Paraburkholderia caballeronis]PXX03655.1 LysR substrate binding domain-containing protein [Paraburkholderia caballeronis]RAK04399.1 LysR substrate binding domain-containing protein [Paraburkholderia caballeronis]SEK93874.1 LysR substrate binding domain-containing protein [Paraburkholderia caballeronis]
MNHHCLCFSFRSDQQVWTFSGNEDITKVAVSGRIKSNNTEVLREVALDGSGIALLPDWLVDKDIEHGRLHKLFDDYDVHPDDALSVISALYLPNQRGSTRIGAFIEFITSLIGTSR